MGIQVGLQDDSGGQFVQMAAAFLAADAQVDSGGARGLGAIAFVPQLDRTFGLIPYGSCQSGSPAALWGGVVIHIQRLPDEDSIYQLFPRDLRDAGCIHQA